jgi:hypothetical protein
LTAEGFLVCRDAVLARCGEQEYHGSEVPILDADVNGWVIVTRPEREVLDPASLKSYAGKPVVLSHPEGEDAFVHSDNIRHLQIGTVLNARRGEGNLRDCVVGDLMITNRPRVGMTDALRAQRHAHERWSQTRMREIAAANKRFWQQPAP